MQSENLGRDFNYAVCEWGHSQCLDLNGCGQCCLLTANIACHENGIPKKLPVKWRFVKKIALQKVNTLNIRTKQYIIPFYPLHLSKFHIHDPIVFLQCGPFNETHIKSSKCSIFNWFLLISLMRFCLEKPLSHETVLDGITK